MKHAQKRMTGSLSLRAATITVLIVFLCVAAFGLLGGCTKDTVPPFITLALPEIPAECVAPPVAEPKLKDGDITAEAAARDRSNLKWALRNERNLRSACAARLQAQRGEAKP